ncbi:hypothetical protein [Candidatus Nitrospira bockiana]
MPYPFAPRSLAAAVSSASLFAVVGMTSIAGADETPIPLLSNWEANMTKFGRQHCNTLAPGAADYSTQLNAVYYDGERVYYQIKDYTGDPTWKYCAGLAEAIYRDGYVIPNGGKVAGFMNFTKGMVIDYQTTADQVSRDTIISMAQRASYCPDGTPLEWTANTDRSREVAYVIMSYLSAEAMGEPRRARLADMVNQALGHIDQWFVTKTAPYVRPFMVGITMQALIQYYEATGDARVPPKIQIALDELWAHSWMPDKLVFMYTDRESNDGSGGMTPAPDLNLIIAPAYAWYYFHTGETLYRDRGDLVFQGGVTNAESWLYLAKQFDQSYWWSVDYVKWRKAAQPGMTTTPVSSPTPTEPTVEPAPAPEPDPTPAPIQKKGKGHYKR